MQILETSAYFRDLDWDKLKTFYYVAKVGNISNAAPFLNLTQSCSSRHIMGLEKHLGYPLFSRRTKGGVQLTRKGEELLEVVETVYLNVKAFTSRHTEPLQPGEKRKIRIASGHTLAAYLINDLILEYNQDHPEILFEVIGLAHNIDVILHDVDIAIQTYDSSMENINGQAIQEPFCTLKKKLYASQHYLEKYGEPKSVNDLKHHHLIMSSYLKGDSMKDGEIYTTHEKLPPAFLSNTFECLIEAAQKGKGIVGIYENMKIVQRANLQNILPDFSIHTDQLYFVIPDYLKDDKDIMDLKGYLRKSVRIVQN